MKKLMVLSFICAVSYTASAQHTKGGHFRSHSDVSIGIVSHYGHGYSFYNPYYTYPYWGYNYSRPTQLDLNIQDIKNEYQDRIRSVRHDKTLTREDRKKNIRALKYEREKAIIEAKREYYKKRY